MTDAIDAISKVSGASKGGAGGGASLYDPNTYDPNQDPFVIGTAGPALINSITNSPEALASSSSSIDALSASHPNTVSGMGESMDMTGEDVHKMVQNLVDSAVNTIKTNTDSMTDELNKEKAAIEQASGA